MLPSLYVKNYRNLKELAIHSLARVNLIIGRNNTGKSTLLEAVSLYASNFNLALTFQFLKARGEFKTLTESDTDVIEFNTKLLSSLFSDKTIGFNRHDEMVIGSLGNSSDSEEAPIDDSVGIRFVKFFEEDSPQELFGKKNIIVEDGLPRWEDQSVMLKTGLLVRVKDKKFPFELADNTFHRWAGFTVPFPKSKLQFIRTNQIDREVNGSLWDQITLTEKEKHVIAALKVIEPDIERITFVEDNGAHRSPVARLATSNSIFPLLSMGDGINRVLTILLALVNSEGGYLLIDEFENGLHYSVQEQLWQIIFKLAKDLNVQVFATTHSEDCIRGFEEVLNGLPDKADGKLIRLDRVDGVIRQVEFDADELRIVNENNMDIR